MSASGLFRVSKNAGSAAVSHLTFKDGSPPTKLLNSVPGALFGTLEGVMVGMTKPSSHGSDVKIIIGSILIMYPKND